MYGQYARTRSFFQNSELAAEGLPKGEELAILEEFRDQPPPEVFTTEYNPPKVGPNTSIRDNLRTAVRILRDAGWQVDKETLKLTHEETGRVFRFEILLSSPLFERIVLPFIQNLARLGDRKSVV